MSFATIAALWITSLVILPLLAHMLRQGRSKPVLFPAARLVSPGNHAATTRSRVRNVSLLLLRAAIVVCLAWMGAVPLVRCNSVSLDRTHGEGIDVVLILDDSASMQLRPSSGESRFETAIKAGRRLVQGLKENDTVALIWAGAPARVALPSTSDKAQILKLLDRATCTDRGTDLLEASQLAEAILTRSQAGQKRVVWLSDLAGPSPNGNASANFRWLPELTQPAEDCGILWAQYEERQVSVTVTCSSERASANRELVLPGSQKAEPVIKPQPLLLRGGSQSLVMPIPSGLKPTRVTLTGSDANPEDDSAPICSGGIGVVAATLSDPSNDRLATGRAPLLEQALQALGEGLKIRPLLALPEASDALQGVDLLLLDDPLALMPEVRATITRFVMEGGISVLFAGPRATHQQLGTNLQPFILAQAEWEPTTVPGLDTKSLAWLGSTASTLSDIAPRGRWRLEEPVEANRAVRGRFSDQRPWLETEKLGRGELFVVALPLALEVSDLGLRSGFLALLSHLVDRVRAQGRGRMIAAGESWRFGDRQSVEIQGPEGRLELAPVTDLDQKGRSEAVPERAGRYEIRIGDRLEERCAIRVPSEIERSSVLPTWTRGPDRELGRVPTDISPVLFYILAGLLGLEALFGGILAWIPQAWRWFRGVLPFG